MEIVQETITSSCRIWKNEELPSTKRGILRTNGLGNPPSVSAKPHSPETSPGQAASWGNAFVEGCGWSASSCWANAGAILTPCHPADASTKTANNKLRP